MLEYVVSGWCKQKLNKPGPRCVSVTYIQILAAGIVARLNHLCRKLNSALYIFGFLIF